MIRDAAPNGKRCRQQTYSDTAIQTCLTMKILFGMALRQTTGFVESLLRLIGLNWAVPDFSTLSNRQKTLAVNIPFEAPTAISRFVQQSPQAPLINLRLSGLPVSSPQTTGVT